MRKRKEYESSSQVSGVIAIVIVCLVLVFAGFFVIKEAVINTEQVYTVAPSSTLEPPVRTLAASMEHQSVEPTEPAEVSTVEPEESIEQPSTPATSSITSMSLETTSVTTTKVTTKPIATTRATTGTKPYTSQTYTIPAQEDKPDRPITTTTTPAVTYEEFWDDDIFKHAVTTATTTGTYGISVGNILG